MNFLEFGKRLRDMEAEAAKKAYIIAKLIYPDGFLVEHILIKFFGVN